MAIFNSYVKLPEGKNRETPCERHPHWGASQLAQHPLDMAYVVRLPKINWDG